MTQSSRRAAAILVAFALFAAAATACSDSTHPGSSDESSGIALVGVQVRSQLSSASARGQSVVQLPPRTSSVPVVQFAKSNRSRGPRTVIRHTKDSSGATISFGLYYERPAGPPSLIYIFANGRIQAIVSPRYRPHGTGFVRTHSRTTVFSDDGTPIRQIVQSFEGGVAGLPVGSGAHLGAVSRAARDALNHLLPRPLHAAAYEAACVSEWLTYLAASAALAAATATLELVAPACLTGVGCALTIPAFVAWLAALDQWNQALDKLISCMDKANDADVTQPLIPGGGGDDGGFDKGGTGETEWPDQDDETRTVMEFIDDAIASGNFWCSKDGNHCYYYAA